MRVWAPVRWISSLLLGLACIAAVHASIVVTYDGPPSGSTCTLAQAISAANAANGVVATAVRLFHDRRQLRRRSARVEHDFDKQPVDHHADRHRQLLVRAQCAAADREHDRHLHAKVRRRRSSPSHTGDPTPTTANAFRFFYVSGGLRRTAGRLADAGQMTVLQGGYAKGGDSGYGGGGAGMGGAIFNQGSLTLSSVSLIGNTAQGGAANVIADTSGGGGMGQDGRSLQRRRLWRRAAAADYGGGGSGRRRLGRRWRRRIH